MAADDVRLQRLLGTRPRRPAGGAVDLPEYLRNPASESGAVVDYRDWHPQLGRRFRALKLWTVLRTYGLSGLRAHIGTGVGQAERFAALVRADERFEIVTEPVLGLVVFPWSGTTTGRWP